MHQFDISSVRYGDSELLCDGWEDEESPVNSLRTKLSKIISRDGNRFAFDYEYDFGDDWQHEILFEGCLQAEKGYRYPLCVEGARACPPEDVEGIYGYQEYLEAMADPKHERHEEFMEWLGEFDPEAFDAGAATKDMRPYCPVGERWIDASTSATGRRPHGHRMHKPPFSQHNGNATLRLATAPGTQAPPVHPPRRKSPLFRWYPSLTSPTRIHYNQSLIIASRVIRDGAFSPSTGPSHWQSGTAALLAADWTPNTGRNKRCVAFSKRFAVWARIGQPLGRYLAHHRAHHLEHPRDAPVGRPAHTSIECSTTATCGSNGSKTARF
ncbi:MAG TPA: hypothetical protein DD670_12280 [Planctomycetaceae bacterium]|nr:hypothetical protein [Planctomycetaceae bacterium]